MIDICCGACVGADSLIVTQGTPMAQGLPRRAAGARTLIAPLLQARGQVAAWLQLGQHEKVHRTTPSTADARRGRPHTQREYLSTTAKPGTRVAGPARAAVDLHWLDGLWHKFDGIRCCNRP